MFPVALLDASSSATTENPCDADRGVIHQFLTGLSVDSCTAHNVQVYLAGPIRIVLILVIAIILTALVKRISTRLVNSLRLVSPLVRGTPRGADRVRTLAGVLGSLFRAIIWIVALLTILGELNINLAPFIATATVIGAAVGFGAQSLVKDFLSGVLILAEDQYGVGDHIVVGTGPNATSGTVESVNLRITRLRAVDGVVYYVPNGDIRTVGNDTETDSQALVDLVVPLGTDLAAAGAAAQDAAQAMARDPEWESVVMGQPMFAGVQAESEAGVTLRVMALTRPGQHFRVAREMRMRILERLRIDQLAWAPEQPAPNPD